MITVNIREGLDLSFEDGTAQELIDAAVAAYSDNVQAKPLRITALVASQFLHLSADKIDFRMHLHKGLSLNKKGTTSQNGRPVKSEYFLGEEKICEIIFAFEDNEYGMVAKRTESLGYCDIDGDIPEHNVIHEQTYDVNNSYDLSEMLKERALSKQTILNEIKGFLNGVLISIYMSEPFNKNPTEITNIFISFWKQYTPAINAFVEVDASAFYQAVESDTDYEFMNFEIAENTTVRSWILSRINF